MLLGSGTLLLFYGGWYFLLLPNDNNHILLYTAMLVHNIYSNTCEQTNPGADIDDITLGAEGVLPGREIEGFLRDFKQFARILPSGQIES